MNSLRQSRFLPSGRISPIKLKGRQSLSNWLWSEADEPNGIWSSSKAAAPAEACTVLDQQRQSTRRCGSMAENSYRCIPLAKAMRRCSRPAWILHRCSCLAYSERALARMHLSGTDFCADAPPWHVQKKMTWSFSPRPLEKRAREMYLSTTRPRSCQAAASERQLCQGGSSVRPSCRKPAFAPHTLSPQQWKRPADSCPTLDQLLANALDSPLPVSTARPNSLSKGGQKVAYAPSPPNSQRMPLAVRSASALKWFPRFHSNTVSTPFSLKLSTT